MGYQVQSPDTSYEAEQVQIAIFRRRGEAGRGSMMQSLTDTTRAMSWNNFLNQHSNLSRLDCTLLYIKLLYGERLAKGLASHLEHKARIGNLFSEEKLLSSQEMFSALSKVVDVLEELNIPYLIGGSVASSTHGIPRATVDADVVVDFRLEHVARFVARMKDNFYVSETAIQEALALHKSFNVIHDETGYKVDLFILKPDEYDQNSFTRTVLAPISVANPRLFRVVSPEDILLQKLHWYRLSNHILNQQWLDILGVLKTKENLDFSYLEEWAKKLNLLELLTKAKDEAGR